MSGWRERLYQSLAADPVWLGIWAVIVIAVVVVNVLSGRRVLPEIPSESRKDRVLRVIMAVGFLNLFAFIAVAMLLGGDAINGEVRAGHYYLGNHGTYTEVSHAVFVYSVCHGVSAVLGMGAALVAGRMWNRPSA